jgi:hypothetical protein
MGRRMPEFLLTKRAESRPAEGKTDSETFMASTANGLPWEADERKDFLRSRPEGRGNTV